MDTQVLAGLMAHCAALARARNHPHSRELALESHSVTVPLSNLGRVS